MTGDALFNEVFLDDVFVPDDCVVGEVNGGWQVARTTLANERVSLSRSWPSGFGVAELLDVVALRRPAMTGGAEQIGGLVVRRATRSTLLGLRATLRSCPGPSPAPPRACASSSACGTPSRSPSTAGRWPARRARSGPGARPAGGPATATGAARHWGKQLLTSEAMTIGGGTTEIQLNVIAERILGLPRDPEPPAA